MGELVNTANERLSAEAFTRQSGVFDEIYASNTIIHYKRDRVRSQVNTFLPAGSRILELNAGTGEDAIFFASQGHNVHATDISGGMLTQLTAKVEAARLEPRITTELCSYTQLSGLRNRGPYNLIFSNFAGLNCTDQLGNVLASFMPLLAEGGLATLVILPKFCLWETLMLFKGKFRTAFRRLNSSKGADAHVEGVHFKCWYYDPSFIVDALKDDFELVALEGLCTFVPPSYIEHFAEKWPRSYRSLKRLEERFKTGWPWRSIGDYYIITLRKK